MIEELLTDYGNGYLNEKNIFYNFLLGTQANASVCMNRDIVIADCNLQNERGKASICLNNSNGDLHYIFKKNN